MRVLVQVKVELAEAAHQVGLARPITGRRAGAQRHLVGHPPVVEMLARLEESDQGHGQVPGRLGRVGSGVAHHVHQRAAILTPRHRSANHWVSSASVQHDHPAAAMGDALEAARHVLVGGVRGEPGAVPAVQVGRGAEAAMISRAYSQTRSCIGTRWSRPGKGSRPPGARRQAPPAGPRPRPARRRAGPRPSRATGSAQPRPGRRRVPRARLQRADTECQARPHPESRGQHLQPWPGKPTGEPAYRPMDAPRAGRR